MFKSILRLTFCIIITMVSLTARSNDITDISGQYWFDFGGERYSFTPGSFEITTDGLSDGFHTFHAYIENSFDISATHTGWFLKQSRKLEENEPLTSTIFVDGQPFRTDKVPVGANGLINLDLDMSEVDLGMHTLGLILADKDGVSLGYRNGIFMRVPTDLQRSTFGAYYFLDNEYKGVLDISGNRSIVHLDIDASSLTSGLHSVTVYLASSHGMATPVKSAWFVKIPEGGEGVKRYSYWLNDDEETLKTIELAEVSNPYSIMSLIDIPQQPFRSKSYSFAVEENAPVYYARNDFKIRFIDPDERVTTASRTFTDVRVKSKPEEIIDLPAFGNISTGVIPSNSIKLYKFDAEIGDSINVRVDRAGMLEVYSPTAETLVAATGADATQNRTFTARQNGTYYVTVHDTASGNSATLDFSHIHKFALLEQDVDRTANRGCFEMKVKGNGFESLQSLSLSGNDAEYPIEQYKVIDNYTLYAMIDLDEKEIGMGDYKLKGYYKDADNSVVEEIVSSSVLTVETPTPVEIDVEIDAPHIAGTPYLANVKVTNRSNVGVWGVPFNIAARHTAGGGKIEFMDFEIVVDEKYKESIPVVHQTENLLNTGTSGSFAPTVIPYLAPGATNTYTLGFTTGPHEIINVYAWAGKPWSEEIKEIQAEDYDVSVLEEPFEGNLFSFVEFCKLYYQLANELYETVTPSRLSVKRFAPEAPQPSCPRVSPRDVANAAAGAAKQSVGSAARSANGLLATRMAGRDMLLAMTGENEYVQQMQNTDRGMLLVGNDLMAAADTQDNMIGNAQALNHLANARNHWRQAVAPNPNPTPTPVDSYQSGDPNDMKGYLSPSGTNHIGIGVKNVTYTIEFENDPEIANASASTIKVTSKIDGSRFDLSSLKATKLTIGGKEVDLPSGHHFVKTLDMRSEINAIAELTFDFDASSGVAEWKLRSLDPLTLEDVKYSYDGILPVNDDSGRGTGYLTFSVDLLPTIADNTTIESSAEIIFDNNKPISTPVWTNVTDFTEPSAKIVSQSTTDNLSFDFTVEGNDNGSGIWIYDLYMRPNDSKKWTAVKTHIDSNTFNYTSSEALDNATFAVLATDHAGNRQNVASLDVLAGDADGNGEIDANDVVATRNHYLGEDIEINVFNADVTNDNVIDTQDATAIINLYLDNTVAKSVKRLKIK